MKKREKMRLENMEKVNQMKNEIEEIKVLANNDISNCNRNLFMNRIARLENMIQLYGKLVA